MFPVSPLTLLASHVQCDIFSQKVLRGDLFISGLQCIFPDEDVLSASVQTNVCFCSWQTNTKNAVVIISPQLLLSISAFRGVLCRRLPAFISVSLHNEPVFQAGGLHLRHMTY